MNYQEIEIETGEKLQIDFTARRKTCGECGEMIRFGIRKTGAYYPVSANADRTGFTSHNKVCVKKEKDNSEFEQKRNQDYLNSL
jgi:hypothetical protein